MPLPRALYEVDQVMRKKRKRDNRRKEAKEKTLENFKNLKRNNNSDIKRKSKIIRKWEKLYSVHENAHSH